MKRSLSVGILIFFFLASLSSISVDAQAPVTFTNPANNGLPANTFTVPAGVTSITVETWGGGGSGGGNAGNTDGGGGGGGGGYSRATLTVVPLNNYIVNVGAGGLTGGTGVGNPGGQSWFNTIGTILANGGAAGNITTNNGNNGGLGGAAGALGTVTGTATFRSTGGDGGIGRNNNNGRGGPGGSSGGNAANGTSGGAWSTTIASAAPAGGGIGGNGGLEGVNGNVSGAPGVGGGGGGGGESASGGAGGVGQVIITYTLPDVSGLSASAATTCIGSGAVVTVSSSNLITGTYTVTYTVSGTNTVASTTSTLTFTAGSPGTGTFTTANLPNAGAANVVQITSVMNAAGNFTNTTVNTAAFTTVASAPATPGAITGTASVCASTAGLVYSIAAVANATTYTWSVPTGWSITAGQGTISATISSGTNGQNGNITVTAGNVCGNSAASSLAVTSASCPITYYSRGGNWDANGSWSTVSHASATNTGTYPIAGDIAIIGGSDAIVVQNGVTNLAATVVVGDDGTTCSLTIGNGIANGAVLTISGDITVNSGGSVVVGGTSNTAGRTGTLNVTNIVLNGSGAFTLGNTSTNSSTVSATGVLNMNGTSVFTVGSLISNNDASHSVTIAGAVVVASGAFLNSGGNGNTTAHVINFQSTLNNSGTLNFPSGKDGITLTVSNAVTNSGSWTSTGVTNTTATGNIIFQNGISSTGTFAAGSATFQTNAQNIGGSTAMSFGNVVTVTGIALTNNNTNTVSITGTGAAQLTGTGTWTQGANSTLSYAGSTITTITLNAATNAPNTVIYTGATSTIYAASYNNLTYSGATTGTVANGTTVNVSGNLTATSGTFTAAGTGTVVFNGSTTQSISGAGAFSFVNVTLAASGANHVNVDSPISFSGVTNFTAANARLLIVASTANITLGNAATFSNFDTNSYVQLDGAAGSNSNLIRTTASNTANWAFTFPIGTSTGGYTPFTIPTIATAPTNGSTLSVKSVVTSDLFGRLKRVFRFTVTGNANATTFSNAVFNYNDATDISSGDVEANYTTAWRFETGGTWAIVASTVNTGANTFTVTGGTVATASLTTGEYYYTIGSVISAQHAWYSYQTGDYSDFNTWTLDPSGTTFDNGLNIYPGFGDEIHILNGFTVTVDLSGQTLATTAIEGGGILDMSTTTGQNLGITTGTGLLRVKGTALPLGTYTDFVATTGGTIEFYDIGGNLSTTQTTFNNLKMSNSTGSNIIYMLVSNMVVNGTFNLITTGVGTVTWQINDASDLQRTITLNGDLTVASGGRIAVGTGNEASTSPHILTLFGNLTNSGIIKLYDETDTELPEANYGNTTAGSNNIYTNELQGNAVTATFSGNTSNTATCNNTTDFYRLVLNKGSGQQAVLTINSSNTSNFRLFGPTNRGSNSGAVPNEYSDNSLSVINGTLKLTGSINIPNLNVNGVGSDYFSIPQNAGIWLSGAGVTVTIADNTNTNGDQRLMLSGTIRVSGGTLNGGNSKGIGSDDGGAFLLESGTVNCWMFRPRGSGTGIFSYSQTGGTFNVGYGYALDGGVDLAGYYRFDLNSVNSTFEMTGGTLNVAKPSNTGGGGGGIQILSSLANYNVTGGTVNVYTGYRVGTTESPFYINTTVPFYNLNVYRESGTSVAQLITNNQIVLNDLTIVNNTTTPTFSLNNLNLTIGGNFNIQTGTTFTPGTGIVTFNGTASKTWTLNGTITSLANVVLSKTTGRILTLAGTNTLPTITGSLTLTSGTLADGGKTVTVTGTLSNNAVHSGAGSITYSNGAASTISGSNGTFGNLTITTSFTHATSGAQTVTGNLRLTGNTILNIGANALTVLGNIYSDGTTGVAFAANKMILTNGVHTAGGLTRQGAAGDLLFPVGTGAIYTPNTINVAATTHGLITVRPVSSEHPNVTVNGQSLQYYWRVTSSGYAGITAVTHKTYTFSTATKSGTLTSYRSARYDATAFSWGTNNTTYNATGTTVIPTFNTGGGWAGVSGDQLDGEYTCGDGTAFGGVVAYYSFADGNWNVNSTWSTVGHSGPAASSTPCANCPVIIGDGTAFNHTVTTVANTTCGTLTLSLGSTLDCSTFTAHDFGASTGGPVTGNGTLRINSTSFPAGDFTNFIGASGGTVEWYGVTKTVPTTGPAPQNLNLATYYNLVLNPSGGATITLPPSNLTIYNNLTQGDKATFTGTAITNGSRTISITGNLAISRGTFNFSSANPSVTTLTVNGNSSVANGATMSAVGGGTANTNTLTTQGSITNNGTLNFRNNQVVNITFTGSNDVVFDGTGTGGTTLNLVTVNKGTSQTPTVDFSVGGTVNTTAVALGWLTLTNGTFNFNNSNTYTISTNTYTIPPTARLKVGAGTVNTMTADNDANDLFLNGALEVSGGTVNVGNMAGSTTTNTDIEYASAGTPTITVSSGALNVKSSIRRSTSTITGALVYNQTGGAVTVGGIDSNSADNNTRGVFEIDANTGSSFTLTGTGSLWVQRQTNNGANSYADVFINPITSNVSSTSTISVGLTTGATQAQLKINIAPAIGNFTVMNGNGTNAQTVRMFSNPLIIGGTLTIPTPSVLVTNSLDVSIAGDLVCTGTYTGGTNTTTFNGTGAQAGTLSSTSTFTDFTVSKTAGTTLTLSGTSPTLQNLNVLTGILDVGSLDLNVRRNITINSAQVGTGSVVVESITGSNTITSSGGSFTNLTLAGTAVTKTVNLTGDLTINGTLNFGVASRYLMIGSNALTFGASAPAVTGVGATDFIVTNGVFSDLGVTKIWGTGTHTFVYPVGTSSNYTPVSFSLNVSTAGTQTIIPVNSAPLTRDQSSPEQILNYYWNVSTGSTLVATKTANHTFSYPSTLFTGTGGTLVAGYLDVSNPVGWVTTGHGGTATTTQMDFTNAFPTNIPPPGFSYDYAVGTVNTLPNPIVPLYSRLAVANVANINVGGPWTTASNWTTDPAGLGIASAVVPNGVPVVILAGARINTTSNGRKAYKTTIDGLLYNGNRTGHNFGTIDGTGTFRTSVNTFPAGNYTAFVASTGGTIEYEPTANMTMNNRSTYNNISIYSGTAPGIVVSMTSTDLIINGTLTVPAGVTLNNLNNSDIAIARDWLNDGTYIEGTGTVTVNGSTDQVMSGNNSFTGLIVSKSGNLTLSGAGSTTVTGNLTLTNGNIIASSSNTLALGSSTLTGGSAGSFIAGPMTKNIGSAASFTAPLGSVSASRYRPAVIANTSAPDSWSIEYVPSDPTSFGYPSVKLNSPTLGTISTFEFWRISPAGATTADLTLSYGTGSYIPPNVGDETHLRVGRWDATALPAPGRWDLPPGGGTYTTIGNNISGTVTVTGVTSFSIVTMASIDINSPLPIELLSFTGRVVAAGVELQWKTALETNNDFFVVEKSLNGQKFSEIGRVKGNGTTTELHQYAFTDEKVVQGKYYYRLKQTDLDGNYTYSNVILIDYQGANQVNVFIYPNPAIGEDVNFEISGLRSDVEEVAISIFDLLGKSQSSFHLNVDALNGTASGKWSVKDIPAGVYFVKIGNSMIKRIIISR